MKVKQIQNALAGEHVVAVSPDLKPQTDAGWQRRLPSDLPSRSGSMRRSLISSRRPRTSS